MIPFIKNKNKIKNVRGDGNQENKQNKTNQRVESKCSKRLYDISYMWKLKNTN